MDFEIVEDLRQYHLEDFEDEYWKRRDKIERENVGKSSDEGMIVRAAFAAGWLGDGYRVDANERVKNMLPAEVVELATAIDAKRRVARAIDPKLLWQLVTTYSGMAPHLALYERLGELKAGEILPVTAGASGELVILDDSTIA